MTDERIATRLSQGELDRRWAAIRAEMAQRGQDALVAQGANDWLGGAVRYLTDLPATNGYPRTIILHRAGGLSVVEMGPFDSVRRLHGKDVTHRGVDEIRTVPAFTSIAYTHAYEGEIASGILRERGARRVGIVGPDALPNGFAKALQAGLEGHASLDDATDWFDEIKSVKSEEELGLIRQAAALQDRVLARVLQMIRPGLRDSDVTNIAQDTALTLGSEQGIFLGGSAKLGRASVFLPRYMQDRTLAEGDHLSLLIEVNGPGGFYTEIARTIVLGRASNELLDGFETVCAAQDHTLGLLRPGVLARDVAAAHDDYMRARALPPEMRLYGHGQGYDMVERPLIRHDETMRLRAGMNLAVHPGFETPSLFAVICDNYILGPDGPGPCLHHTEKKVFEV
jgi:Xaa-Pro aminopeptidase